MTTHRIVRVGLLGVLLVSGPALRAQPAADDLRSVARNPVGDAIKIPVTDGINFDAGPFDRTANALQVFAVVPFAVADNWLLIPRIVTTLLVYVPNTTQASGGSTGLGDTIATVFVTPAHTGPLIWGVGPSLLAPTATNVDTGPGSWGLGPSLALMAQAEWGSAVAVVKHIWSFPRHLSRGAVNLMEIETSLSYNLPRNWYLVTAPTIDVDWTRPRGDRRLVPIGGGVGRTLNMAGQQVDVNIAVYANPIRPARHFSSTWQISLQCTLLYVRTRKPGSD